MAEKKGGVSGKNIRIPLPKIQRFQQPMVPLSKAQLMLQEVIGGKQKIWGTGQNLPKFNRSLTSGNGLIKSGDIYRETGGLFGLR